VSSHSASTTSAPSESASPTASGTPSYPNKVCSRL
jgi:hypothetical protein